MGLQNKKNSFFTKFSFLNEKIQKKRINFKIKTKKVFKNLKNTFILKKCSNAIKQFQIKVLKTGTLKNHILIKYLFKDLFLYFFVSFLFFFMIFFVNQILLTVEDLLDRKSVV